MKSRSISGLDAPSRRNSRAALFVAAAGAVALCAGAGQLARGAIIWNLPAGGSWNTAANWNPATVPNAVGANATFNNAASGSNPAQTGNRTVTADGAQTVGSIDFNNDAANTFTNSVTTGTSGSVIMDEVGAGPAVINVPAAVGTGNNTISAPMTLNDNVTANVSNVTASSAAGALNLTAAMSGSGGFTKNGDGMATFGTGAKSYTGATVLNGGRMRMSAAAAATASSSFTINNGAQLTLLAAGGNFALGAGVLNLNGSGPLTGPFSTFAGAIRNETGSPAVITNASVVLQSDTMIHVQGAAAGVTTLQGVVSGTGKLIVTAPNSNADIGSVVLNGANTYSGGTLVAGGILQANSAAATFGTGDVTVDDTTSPTSVARISISTGVLNAIGDGATLRLLGGGAAGVADENFAILGTGVNDSVAALILGGVSQPQGTYGSSTSPATNQLNEYFSGNGIITVVPEPASMAVLMLGGGLGLCRRSRRRV